MPTRMSFAAAARVFLSTSLRNDRRMVPLASRISVMKRPMPAALRRASTVQNSRASSVRNAPRSI